MISLMVINEIATMHTLLAAVTTAAHMTHSRDPETGSHLDRMSRYARLIARSLAKTLKFPQATEVYTAALLHDVGKIILSAFVAEDMAAIEDLMARERWPMIDAERKRPKEQWWLELRPLVEQLS